MFLKPGDRLGLKNTDKVAIHLWAPVPLFRLDTAAGLWQTLPSPHRETRMQDICIGIIGAGGRT